MALAAILAAARACAPAPALAEPCAEARGLATGTPAPCDGVLWPSAATVAALRCARVELPTCRADARFAAALAAAELQAERERGAILAGQVAVLQAPAPWYRSQWLALAAGVVVGAAAAAGAVSLAGGLR